MEVARKLRENQYEQRDSRGGKVLDRRAEDDLAEVEGRVATAEENRRPHLLVRFVDSLAVPEATTSESGSVSPSRQLSIEW